MSRTWIRKTTWTWTNWTFGVWWAKFGLRGIWCGGVDIGPLEIIWREKLPPRKGH